MEKNTRGITLIALIITIIVMLILVTVTIRVSKEGALFGHAGNAVKQTRNEIAREQEILNMLGDGGTIEDVVIKATGGWYKTGDDEFTNGTLTVALGDYINYECYNDQIAQSKLTYTATTENTGWNAKDFEEEEPQDQLFTVTSSSNDLKWRVIGVENGNLLIAMDGAVVPKKTEGNVGEDLDGFYLRGATGYNNGINELNKISSIYGHGNGAVGARSINMKDINKLFNYDPNHDPRYDGHPYRYGELFEYGNIVTCTKLEGNRILFEGSNGTTEIGEDIEHLINLGESSESDEITVVQSLYFDDGLFQSADMLQVDLYAGGMNYHYYFAERAIEAGWDEVAWCYIGSAVLIGSQPIYMWTQDGACSTQGFFGVRPVVMLRSDINLVADETAENTWNIE